MVFKLFLISEKAICSLELFYNDIDNKVSHINQEIENTISRSKGVGKIIQSNLPERDIIYSINDLKQCDSNGYWYVDYEKSYHTIIFDNHGKDLDDYNELFEEIEGQYLLNLQGTYYLLF